MLNGFVYANDLTFRSACPVPRFSDPLPLCRRAIVIDGDTLLRIANTDGTLVNVFYTVGNINRLQILTDIKSTFLDLFKIIGDHHGAKSRYSDASQIIGIFQCIDRFFD